MEFHCQFKHYPQPCDPQFYLRPVTVDVMCFTESGNEALAGRLAFDLLDIGRAEVAGENLYEICDADSAGWEGVYAALFEPEGEYGEIRQDFDFYEPIDHVLFLYRMVFHPAIRSWQSFILDHTATLFGYMSALIMWKGMTDLTDKESSDLGFRIVAGRNLLFRPNMMKNEYSAEDDNRSVMDLVVPEDAGEYVERAWED